MSKTLSIDFPQAIGTSKYTCKTELLEGLEEILAEASNLSMSNTATGGGETITIFPLLCFQKRNDTVL